MPTVSYYELNNSLGPAPLEHIEDYSAKKPAPSVHAATVMNGSVFPSSTKTYSLSQTNTPKSKRAPGTDIKIPIQDQSPKISKPSARLQTEFETEATKNGSESARNVRVPTNQSTSVKKNSVDRTSVASPKIPVEDRLLQHNQQREVFSF